MKTRKKILEKMYWKEKKTIREIAKFVGIDNSNVLRQMKKYGIKTRTRAKTNEINRKMKLTKEELDNLYNKKKLSVEEIASIINCKIPTIYKWLYKYGVVLRTVGESNKIAIKSGRKGVVMPKNTGRTWFKKGDIRLIGKNNPMWKGGVTPKNEIERKSREYKKWREDVFKRDVYTCQKCGQRGGYLHAHHIKAFAKYPELRFVISNGQTLCSGCHFGK